MKRRRRGSRKRGTCVDFSEARAKRRRWEGSLGFGARRARHPQIDEAEQRDRRERQHDEQARAVWRLVARWLAEEGGVLVVRLGRRAQFTFGLHVACTCAHAHADAHATRTLHARAMHAPAQRAAHIATIVADAYAHAVAAAVKQKNSDKDSALLLRGKDKYCNFILVQSFYLNLL